MSSSLDARLYPFSPFRYTPESPTSLDWLVTSWTYLWLLLCDFAILVLRSFGRYRSSLGKLVYPGWHNIGYVRSWLSRLMWTVHLLDNMFTRIRFTLFSMFYVSSTLQEYWSLLTCGLSDLFPMALYHNGPYRHRS